MKRYRFALEGVLRVRRIEEERAREELLAANMELRGLIQRRDAEARRYESLARVASATTSPGLRLERLDSELALEAVGVADERVFESAGRAALAQIRYRSAAARVEALERLDGRQRSEHRLEEQREVSSLLDDIVTARYVREHNVGGSARR